MTAAENCKVARNRAACVALITAAFCAMLGACSGVSAARSPAPLAIGQFAPDFSLPDAHAPDGAAPVKLSALLNRGPVLLIFYLGYECPRCVTHLADIDGRLPEFDAAGLQVLAISPDPASQTRDSAKQFGDFHFPLLSDPDNVVARGYGLTDSTGHPLHGAFIVDRTGHIRFAASGEHPFTDLDKLLAAGHQLEGQ